jgi:2-dehydro-3-deoxyphosphogluconate aldolase/(4S)-4-hydroxy-2-oxoglutarate aldolase
VSADDADRAAIVERVVAARVIAIIRLRAPGPLEQVAAALVAGGITALEITLTTPGALDAVTACRARFGGDVLVGAGSVLDAEAARRCIEAGAQLLVSPVVAPEVVRAAHTAGVPALPGAMTPTEIWAAHATGADLVKVFPARSLGPRYITDVLAPLPGLRLVPTGGIDETNAADHIAAGATAVAVGGRLVDEAAVAAGDWDALTQRAAALVEALRR